MLAPQMVRNSSQIGPGLVVSISALLRLPLLVTPLTYESDGWRQSDTASIARLFLENGFHLLYPQIYWGGDGPGYVEAEFQLYSFTVAVLYKLFGEHLWLGRLVSLLLSIPTLLIFHLLARRMLPAREALGALIFFALSPLYLRYSVAFMPEATVLFFYVAALYAFLRWIETAGPAWLILCGVMTAAAILVKPTAIHIGLIFLLLIVRRWGPARLLRGDLWRFALISLLPALLWYWHARGLYLRHGNTFGVLSGGDSKLGGPRYWLDPAFYASLARLELAWLLTPLGCVPAILGLRAAWRRGADLPALGIATMGLYYLLVARYAGAPWGVHYHLYALPYYALAVGFSLSWFSGRWGGWPALLCAGYLLLGASPVYQDMLATQPGAAVACGEAVNRLVPAAERIVVSSASPSHDGEAPNNYQDPVVFFHARRHGFSLAADRHTMAEIERLRARGARHVVFTEEPLHRLLAGPLGLMADPIGPGIDQGCAVYRLR